MSFLLRQTRAAQFSAAAVLMTAAITALPLLATDQFGESYYANQIVQSFQKLGAESGSYYNNTALATSAFDFGSYFANTCYRPTDFDMPRCTTKFGPYANLKTTYDSGALKSILSRISYLKDIGNMLPGSASYAPPASSSMSSSSSSAASIAPAPIVIPSYSSSASSSLSAIEVNRTDRASQVWKLCVINTTRENAVKCYQRNIRLIMERTEDVEENLIN